jgi:hypothetical protein
MLVAALSANDHTTYDWVVDLGATQHMTFGQEWFVENQRRDVEYQRRDCTFKST